ncbi:MAG: hypothetical protein KDC42_01580 [Ignavibacteriae bacterium]|nr:hypothetical protein [Ignavibacteriota bacterium]
MSFNFKYVPIFRVRQQEIIVLTSFNFSAQMFPLLEIIKEKDRTNNARSSQEIYSNLIQGIDSEKVLIDLPVYFNPTVSTTQEVIRFYRQVISNLDRRIEFYNYFRELNSKVIPVLSSISHITGEENSIQIQRNSIGDFSIVAYRLYHKRFNKDFAEIKSNISQNDIILYDVDDIPITNPVVKKQSEQIHDELENYSVIIRSALNNDIQNNRLQNDQIVGEADNSLIDFYSRDYNFNAFGDYVGIKKDDLTSGGSVSPGFIIYEPVDNVYYGFSGNTRVLSEFEDTIVPQVLNSQIINSMTRYDPRYLDRNNSGYQTLLSINSGNESGKSQAKFKRISMDHYLHSIRTSLINRRIN